MKKIITAFLMITSVASATPLTETLKNSLQGSYKGNNCSLEVSTEDFGDGYYKRLDFVQNGNVLDSLIIHTASLERISGHEGEAGYVGMNEEVGSDGEDKWVDLQLYVGPTGTPLAVSYKMKKFELSLKPFKRVNFICENLVRQ